MSETRSARIPGSLPTEWNTGVFRGVTRGRQAWMDNDRPRGPGQAPAGPMPVKALLPPKTIPYSALKLTISQEWHEVNERYATLRTVDPWCIDIYIMWNWVQC